MGSKVNSQQAPVQWLREITKAKLNPFLFPSFYLNNGKRGEKGNLDKFGQFRASQDKATIQKNGGKGRKNKKRKQQMGKGNKNLSDDREEGEGGGGESRVQNSSKAFGELIINHLL